MCPSRMWYRQAWWDCGTDRTLGQLPRVGVLGTPGETVGQIEHWNKQLHGNPWDVPGTSAADRGEEQFAPGSQCKGAPKRCQTCSNKIRSSVTFQSSFFNRLVSLYFLLKSACSYALRFMTQIILRGYCAVC